MLGSEKMPNYDKVIDTAKYHSIKKFELIERYVKAWAEILMLNEHCNTLVFIDCMSNSGEYKNAQNENSTVMGTPVRVSQALKEVAKKHPDKRILIYFNDFSEKKIEHLRSLVEKDDVNFHTIFSIGDGNILLKKLAGELSRMKNTHFLLEYDPFDATIDWEALMPFLNNWGEVIINHSIQDSTRAVKMARSEEAINKYEKTYLTNIENLIPYGSDKDAYENRIQEIIKALHLVKDRKYYVASFPFFNSKNAIMYNLIHCTSNLKGFKLYKTTAWQTFGGKSSTKNTHGKENQIALDFDGIGLPEITTDTYCYYVQDIAIYLQKKFNGQKDISLDSIWKALEEHPVFPSEGFRKEIKNELKTLFGAKIGKTTITFAHKGLDE